LVLSLNRSSADTVHFLYTIRGLKEVSLDNVNNKKENEGDKNE
jgi:hypothetical protein